MARLTPTTTWFERGAQAVTELFPDIHDVYVCPICARGFDRIAMDWLTVEHAPPRSIGGRGQVLTCWVCNNRSSTQMDPHVERQNALDELRRGALRRPIRGEVIDPSGIRSVVNLEPEGKSLKLTPVAKATNPAHLATLLQTLPKMYAEGAKWEFTLNIETPDSSAVQRGWLRSGFLAAFAVFGYRFALAPWSRDLARDKIDRHGADCSMYVLTTDLHEGSGRVYLVREPSSFQGHIVVAVRNRTILLQGRPDRNFLRSVERFRVRAETSGEISVRGPEIPWPVDPMHLNDKRAEGEPARDFPYEVVRREPRNSDRIVHRDRGTLTGQKSPRHKSERVRLVPPTSADY